MTKYNTKRIPTQGVENKQGGQGIQFSPEMELISLLATGFDGRYYEKENEREKRLISLIKEVGKKDPELVAKSLVYARSVMGQRSITHVGAVAALNVLSGSQLATRFYTKRSKNKNSGGIVFRLDDMLEIAAYYFLRNPGKPLPNAIKRGFKQALESCDAYELAKYQAKNKKLSMLNIVNIVHPKPSEKMAESFKLLKKGKLKQFNTSEDKNSKAGQIVAEKVRNGEISKADAEVELNNAKADNWKELISNETIGYFALLRNLRNIADVANDETFNKALTILTDEKRVRKSLVFPHQIDLAFEVILKEGLNNQYRKNALLVAINKAYELAIPNLSELFTHGKTAVVVDTSGSMKTNYTKINGSAINSRAVDKAALIGATLSKGIGADMYHFSRDCEVLQYNPLDSINTIKNMIIDRATGGSTIFESIFNRLNGKYERIFVISDMQGGDTILKGSSYQSYVNKHGQPFIYSIDLCGYGTTMFRQTTKLTNLFGYSSDIYEQIKSNELNPKKILEEIRKIEI